MAAEGQDPPADDLAALDADYQTHCVECFLGMPEHCTEGLAPNGQPCATTPAQRIAWLLDVVRLVVAQRNQADAKHAALTARLATVAGERDSLRRQLAEMDDVAGNVAAERDEAEAARDALRAELDRTRQHFRTRHGISCAFTEESAALPEDMEPPDGR